ncbi:MAG: FAD-binding protein [Clostridiales bacterium]|nr:FAD-binding protein [Clostridiales bacterium]
MNRTMEVDVAVMGSGVAGMGAAYKLANAGGLKIAVFEKYPAQGGAVSNCPMSFCSTPDTPEAQKSAYEVLGRFSNYTANMGLVSKAIKYSSELPDLILNQLRIEAPMVVNRPPAEYGTQRGYTVGHANGLDVGDIYFLKGRGQGHAFALMLLRLRFMLEKKGVEFYFSTPIKKIIRDSESGKVTGAVAYDKEGNQINIRCKALIVASGGISGNIEMMKEEGILNTKFEDAYKDGGQVMITFPDSCQDGDGQKAVWAIGGKKTGFAISADPEVPNPGVRVGPNTPWLSANQIKIITEQPYLRVNELGKRFINEEMSNNHTAISSSLALNCPNMAGYMIFDEDTAKALGEKVENGYVYFIFKGVSIQNIRGQIDEAVAKGNQHMCHFDTIHEICEYMGINEAGLRKTLEKYNKAAETGIDEDFKTNPKYIKPVREESGHIYCFRILAGGYDTMGGLAIDENANVVDKNNLPIEGLYAGGDMATGSLLGNPPVNAGGNVYCSMTTGLLAGDSAAAYVKGEC